MLDVLIWLYLKKIIFKKIAKKEAVFYLRQPPQKSAIIFSAFVLQQILLEHHQGLGTQFPEGHNKHAYLAF